jgi:hypothetical protein
MQYVVAPTGSATTGVTSVMIAGHSMGAGVGTLVAYAVSSGGRKRKAGDTKGTHTTSVTHRQVATG